MYTVTKRLEISAAHQLSLDYESKCKNLHGHNWIIYVTCQSEKLDANGMDVGYIPKGKVIGISKIARIADAVTKRLQIQERIGKEIRDILTKILGTEDVIVVIQGEHSCMTARGIKKPGVKTKTASCGGQFLVNAELRKEFYLVYSK